MISLRIRKRKLKFLEDIKKKDVLENLIYTVYFEGLVFEGFVGVGLNT